MFKDIKIDELLQNDKKDWTLVDVRSPSEFHEMTMPGSINIPVFDDEERAEVGTLYKQVSPEIAKERGLEIFSAKLPAFIKKFQQIEGEIAVFCWRGGMRSKTAATMLDLMGIRVLRLQGGVRTYRQWVLEQMEGLEINADAYVLNGGTGIGKTTILKRLQEKGKPVLDLEGLAGHRGSVFGHIGTSPNNQKKFDSLLQHEISQLQSSPYIVFEAESKRIGKVTVPDTLLKKKEQGTHIFIEMPMEQRVLHILEEYKIVDHTEELRDAFQKIKSRIHTPIAREIQSHLDEGEYKPFLSLLLEHYYDPKYKHAAMQYPEDQKITLHVNNIEEAVEKIMGLLPITTESYILKR
ncbi:tRNA 2-selenouridine(34) synthase MnmH [Rossellomorea vietnamensis]|uniref:tRNA 2-selenouridine(34) synthase MnmH n=1 Tax=Rossellomorea vietnamensis TaxID=218284 RepID=A0A5D4K750_9BACI|nr:tRNA 2-selenouridine(34) synthase MnmH [Rossellomorea vietnamensis]TYR72540.1 tRNA 2-selenouridine(34) synthase MnmH [Rossellomorea vietnamensis]